MSQGTTRQLATRRESNVVYVAGLVQGIALVTFPAASSVFTDPKEYDLSSTQYGAMFVPQVLAAIAASLLGARLARRFTTKLMYLLGLSAGLISMLLLVTSQFFTSDQSLAYGLLLAATAFLGAGFGLTVPALNTFTAVFHPDRVDRSVLILNALLGLGTALAPVFVALFVGVGFWWGLPVMSSVLMSGLLAISVSLRLRVESPASSGGEAVRSGMPHRFWLFAAFAVLYGICETMNGNWAEVDMRDHLGASTTLASVALTAFWGTVTLGRVGSAAIQRRFPTWRTYHVLPFVLAGAFVVIAVLPHDTPALGVPAFALAGLGCSALLPLTISFGQEQLVTVAASVAGGVIAAYQLGFGVAAFGAGPLQAAGLGLPTLFGLSAVVASVMGAMSFALARRTALPRIHPRP